MPGEPAGLVLPRAAGAVEFRATLSWETPENAPRESLPGLSNTAWDEAVKVRLTEESDPSTGIRTLAGEVRALGRPELGRGLEGVLRAVTTAASLTEAVLEVETVRSVVPSVASPRALEGLARDLWEGGFPVRFAPSWTPVVGADVAVGDRDGELGAF